MLTNAAADDLVQGNCSLWQYINLGNPYDDEWWYYVATCTDRRDVDRSD